jgi:hypothetical protein
VEAQAILHGTYNPPAPIDHWAAKLIGHLQQVLPTAPIVDLSPAQYAAGWKRVKEKTSAGRSGITIPHMKAHSSSDYLNAIDTIMANIPYRYGFSPLRWQQGLDVMLEKKAGIRQLSTLRAILLYEADFNQNNKRLGREMLFRAETGGAVAIEQFGSRKHMSAIDQSLNKALTFDIWRQLRQRGALCSNDAKSCYDRIAHNCASLCLQRVGTPAPPIISMFETIQKLKHYVRTVYGESEIHFVQQGPVPLQGVGQGNGAGPQIWALVSTPVFNMLRDEGLGSTFTSALSKMTTKIVGFAFVDDTDLITSGPSMTLDEVIRNIQLSLTAWEGGIRATGGAIEPRKSHWYLVDFAWKDGKPSYRTVQQTHATISVRDPQGDIRPLKQLEPWEAERTLGVRLAPDGNMESQFDWMLRTARLWTDKIRAGHLPRHLTGLAWRTTIQKTLEYPLPTTTLSLKQCDKITSEIAKVALPRCGILRTFPRALMYAPLKLGGLNIPNLYVEQGISHIIRLVRYSKSKSHSTGILLRQSCEALKLELGANGPVFQNSLAYAPLAADSWVKSTWQFVQEFGISIHDDIKEFLPIREHDRLLVPLFVHFGFRGDELQRLNQCRLYLKVSWLSEIVTGDGRYIELSAWEPPFGVSIKVEFMYPNQAYPPPTSWHVWKSALRRLCNSQRTLTQPLGPYIRDDTIQWWLDAASERLHLVSQDSIKTFRKSGGKRTRFSHSQFIYDGISPELPPQCIPVTVRLRKNQATMTGAGDFRRPPTTAMPNMNWILESLQIPANLTKEWGNHNICAVSDGSFKNQHGTAAWMVYISEACIIYGGTISPGDPTDQSAYRSELVGIYGIAATIWLLENEYHLIGDVMVGCDGLSALRQASKQLDFINPNEPQFDVIMAIRRLIADSSWSWQWRHVKGHQDEFNKVDDLDKWSQWNIKMDAQAKETWKRTTGKIINPSIFGEPWSTVINGKKLTSNLRESLREYCAQRPAMEYWDGKRRFGSATAKQIDWDSFGAAMKQTPPNRQRWVSKTVSGFCSTGKMMQRRRERTTDECPRCGQPEDVEHVWRCQVDTASIWQRAMSSLNEWLISNSWHPEMSRLIIEGLSRWHDGSDLDKLTTTIPWLQDIITKQTECGWRNFFEGMLLIDWKMGLKLHFGRIRSAKSPRRWISALIRKLWQVAWDLWEHRNGYLHQSKNNLWSQQLDSEITNQFAIGCTDLDEKTRCLFQKGEQHIRSRPLDIKKQWVKRIQVAREQAAIGAYGTFQAERKMMAKWLHQ